MSQPTLTPFADLLREHRLVRRLTQDALAERARMSVDAISALERGFRRAPQRATVALLVAALALEGEDLQAFEAAAGAANSAPSPRRRAAKPLALASPLRDGVAHLIGRDAEREAVRVALVPGAVATICGTGGIGKTELALAVAHDARAARTFDDVRFIALAPLGADGLGDAVARAFELPSGLGPADLAQSLAARRALVVLDNCEHVAAAACALASELTRVCPGLAILATSRRPLAIVGERAIALAPLDARAAAALFVERAREVDARFTIEPHAAPLVAEICRRLDGIALAIEIAARRTRVLSVAEIAARLDRRFRLLVNDRATEHRQRTLEALVGWSYDLLEPRERRFFDRLSIFPDGFTLEAAHAVALADAGDEYDALDLLERLVTNSLVVRGTASDGTTRFGLLETLRAFGAQRLNERDDGADVRRKLLAYVDALFTAGGIAYEHEARVATLARLDAERETFSAALDAANELGEDEAGAQLFARVPALRRWLRDDDIASRAAGYLQGMIHRVHRVDGTPAHALAARLEIRLGNASSRIDAPRSLPAFERALAYARLANDEAVRGRALVANALGLMRLRRFDEARAALDEADGLEASAEARKERRHTRALLALYRGEFDYAAAAFAEIAEAERALGNAAFEFDALHFLAEAHVGRGDIDAALEAADLAEPLSASVGPHPRAAFRASRAAYACFADDAPLGLSYAREALEIRPRDNVWPHALRHAALACALLGHVENAARLDGRAEECMRAMAFFGYATERIARERLTALLASDLGETRLRALRLEGARATDDAVPALLPMAQVGTPRTQRLA